MRARVEVGYDLHVPVVVYIPAVALPFLRTELGLNLSLGKATASFHGTVCLPGGPVLLIF